MDPTGSYERGESGGFEGVSSDEDVVEVGVEVEDERTFEEVVLATDEVEVEDERRVEGVVVAVNDEIEVKVEVEDELSFKGVVVAITDEIEGEGEIEGGDIGEVGDSCSVSVSCASSSISSFASAW